MRGLFPKPAQYNPAVRAYRSADFPAVAEIYGLARPFEFQNESPHIKLLPLTEDAEVFQRFQQARFLVFEQQGVIKGFAGYEKDYIGWLYVHPAYQRQHIGKALLQVLFKQMGVPQVRLSLLNSNHAAKALYKSLGFVELETFPFELQGIPVEGVRMARMTVQENRYLKRG